MRKSRKVVPITRKRKPANAIKIPVQVEGAIRILTCHRTPAQISFSLGPPLASGEAPLLPKPKEGNLLCECQLNLAPLFQRMLAPGFKRLVRAREKQSELCKCGNPGFGDFQGEWEGWKT